jgi:hypothetical protein
LNWCTQFPYMKLERPDHEDWRPDGWTLYAWLALWRRASGREHTSSGRLQLSSHICVLKRNLSTCWILNCPDGCKMEQFEGSWHKGRSERKFLVIRMDDAWTVERLDEISHRPAGCKGSDFSNFESVQNLLEPFL